MANIQELVNRWAEAGKTPKKRSPALPLPKAKEVIRKARQTDQGKTVEKKITSWWENVKSELPGRE